MPAEGSLRLERDPSDPTRTLLVLNGQAVGSVPWQQCDEIAATFMRAARAGEEIAKAPQLIAADAALIRTGAPFALTANEKIREEAFKNAQWDTAARRGMPLRGVPSRRRCGVPSLVKHR